MAKRANMSIDRLSALPDSILSHILSLLPTTKAAVQTTILSRRWTSLWSQAPTLHLNGQNPPVINRVIMRHQARNLDSFHLTLSLHDEKDCTEYQLETWILSATDRNVKQLHLSLYYIKTLPRRLLTCETLVDLSLDGCHILPVDAAVCLPRLKKLSLDSVLYEADESLPDFLSGCPVLEELEIRFALRYPRGSVCCHVSSCTLRRLTVWTHPYGRGYRLLVNAPALEYLHIDDLLPENVLCGALTSLIEAELLFPNIGGREEGASLYSSASIFGLVDRVTNVKCLRLYLSNPTKIVDSLLSTWTMSFRNLTKLCLVADCRFLFKILENADSLEILYLNKASEEIKEWIEPKKVPTCLLSRVRTINLAYTKHEFEIVRYLLRNAQVLQRMEIIYPDFSDFEEKKHVLEEISRLERGSGSCELAFGDWI